MLYLIFVYRYDLIYIDAQSLFVYLYSIFAYSNYFVNKCFRYEIFVNFFVIECGLFKIFLMNL